MGRIVVAAPVCLAFDVSVKLTSVQLDEFARMQAKGIIRYTPLPGVNPAHDIDVQELDAILSHPANFGTFWVQHPRFPNWAPEEHDPEIDARWACNWAKSAGYEPGTHGFCDCEGMRPDTTEAQAFAYVSKWCHVAVEEGYRAGAYDGYSTPLTPTDYYEIPDATCYWSDLADRKVAKRGVSILQEAQIIVKGIAADPDRIALDNLGGSPFWTVTQQAAA